MQATYAKARFIATAATLSLLLNSVMAQTASTTTTDTTTTTTTTTAPAVANGPAPQVLSPFVVDTSKDVGYAATNTLAGSRINTPVKDLANGITIVTKDFFDDVSAVDVNDILSYTVSSEGVHQFLSTDNVLNAPDDLSAANRESANRIRGLAAADISRDYFNVNSASDIGFDTYNLDEVTINRGPNSVLFGEGSASGDINYSPQTANFGKTTSEVTFRFGSYGDQRATFNTNFVAIPDVLAVRVAGEWASVGFQQQPAHDRDRRIYTALTWQPLPKTTFRASYEHVSRDQQAPNTFSLEDYVTPWVAAGSPTYAYPTGGASVDSSITIIYDKNGQLEGAREGIDSGGNAGQYNALSATPAGFYVPTLSNNKYLNLETTNTYGVDYNMQYNVFEASVDQEILPGLNLDLGYFKSDFMPTRAGLFRTNVSALRIDNYSTYGDGTANPHFGELYQDDFITNFDTDPEHLEEGRATLTYNLDLRNFNKWLGHYNLTGFAESENDDHQENVFNEVPVTGDPAEGGGATTNATIRRYYMGGGANTPASNPKAVQIPSLVSNIPLTYYNPTANVWTQGTLSTEYDNGGLNEDASKLNTRAFIGQAYLIPWAPNGGNDLLVGTVGVRSDSNSDVNRNATGGNLAVQTLPSGYGPPIVDQRQTTSVGVVAHPLSWLSLHWAHSENFQPNAGTVDLFGNPTPSPVGTGKDYGFSVDLFGDTLNLKVNWWDEEEANGFEGQPARILAQWTLPLMDYGYAGPVTINQLHLPYSYIDNRPNHIIWGDGRLENGSYTANNYAKGTEVELTYNVTKNWRIMANISRQYAVLSNIAKPLIALANARIAYWASIPGLLQTTALASSGVAWDAGNTVQQEELIQVIIPELQVEASEGQPSPELSKYRGNAITNYSFTDGKLKGWSIGGGIHDASRPIIGNPYHYQVLNGVLTPVGLDSHDPYLGSASAELGIDGWVGYKMKVDHDKYLLSFQLNARDLNSSGGLEVVAAAGPDPNGNVVNEIYAIKQPRTFFFTTKLDF